MRTKELLEVLQEEIHSVIIATVDKNGLPATRVIDIMLYDEDSIYFMFQFYEGQGEYFDLSTKPIIRVSFQVGSIAVEKRGYVITQQCIGCKLCYSKCPQQSISFGKPLVIQQEHCLHCGNCMFVCPLGAVEKK